MSKRNRRKFQLGQSSGQSAPSPAPQKVSPLAQHATEYRIIRNDLIRVVIVNLIFLAAVLGLYLANRQSNFLEQWYGKLF